MWPHPDELRCCVMLLLGLIGVGFAVSFALALLLAGSWRVAAVLVAVGVAAWFGAFVYLEQFAECSPDAGECNPAVGWFLLLFVLAGWLVGAPSGRVVRAMVIKRRVTPAARPHRTPDGRV